MLERSCVGCASTEGTGQGMSSGSGASASVHVKGSTGSGGAGRSHCCSGSASGRHCPDHFATCASHASDKGSGGTGPGHGHVSSFTNLTRAPSGADRMLERSCVGCTSTEGTGQGTFSGSGAGRLRHVSESHFCSCSSAGRHCPDQVATCASHGSGRGSGVGAGHGSSPDTLTRAPGARPMHVATWAVHETRDGRGIGDGPAT